jgi:transposase-like protein
VEATVAKRRSRAEWRRIIEAYEATGGTHAAYAEAHGLGLASFRKWLYEFRAHPVPAATSRVFVEVVADERRGDEELADASLAPVEVRVGPLELRFSAAPEADWLADVCTRLMVAAARLPR